jgi:hypothetical protein
MGKGYRRLIKNKTTEPKDQKNKQQDMTELNGDGNRERGRYGEDIRKKK